MIRRASRNPRCPAATIDRPSIDRPRRTPSSSRAARPSSRRCCVHAGEENRRGALDTPIVLSSAFGFASADEAAGAFRGENDAYIYGRWGNPTVEALEAKLAALEGAEACARPRAAWPPSAARCCRSARAASHIVAPRAMYAESARLLRERLPRFGIDDHVRRRASTPGAYARAITPATRLALHRDAGEPLLGVTDIAAIVALGAGARRSSRSPTTRSPRPSRRTPHALGVDLVVHSMTKALGGHGDAIGGAICGARATVERARDLVVKGFGGVISPFTAFLVARGLRTFALRQRQPCASAADLAARLAEHPRRRARSPPVAALPPRPRPGVGGRCTRSARSSRSSSPDGGTTARSTPAARVLEGVKTITHAVSLGDVRSLLVAPGVDDALDHAAADRERAGIADGLLRLSVGIEGTEDLWRDLEARPLARSRRSPRASRAVLVLTVLHRGSPRRRRRAAAQSEERQRQLAARQDRGVHRAERLGQVVARVRHNLRRGAAPLRRVAQRLRAAVPRAARQARRRAHRRA